MAFRRRTKQVESTPGPAVTPLTDVEDAWRTDQLAVGRELVHHYTSRADVLPSLDQLDACVTGWLTDDDGRVDVNVLVNGVGVAFGEHLGDRLGLAWVIATDEQGSDLALHGQPGDILIYPASTVAKRIVAGETGFVRPLFEALVSGVEQRRSLG